MTRAETLRPLIETFAHVLSGLAALRRWAKNPAPEDVVFAVGLLPASVQLELTPAHVLWAAKQLVLDPNPPEDMLIPIMLMRYLYPIGAGGQPIFEGGFRKDLQTRISSDAFCPLEPQRPEYQLFEASRRDLVEPIAFLASYVTRASGPGGRQSRIARLERLAKLTGVPNPRDPAPPNSEVAVAVAAGAPS